MRGAREGRQHEPIDTTVTVTATNKSKCKRCHVTEHTVSFVVFVNMFIHPACQAIVSQYRYVVSRTFISLLTKATYALVVGHACTSTHIMPFPQTVSTGKYDAW